MRVNFTPVGEIATVNGSPSISISRRISFKSFVAMWFYTPEFGERLPSVRIHGTSRAELLGSRRQDVLGVPLAAMLPESGITDETGFGEHDVSGLKDALQVGRILLHQGQQFAKTFE